MFKNEFCLKKVILYSMSYTLLTVNNSYFSKISGYQYLNTGIKQNEKDINVISDIPTMDNH